MACLYRKCQVLTNFLASPFFLGLLIGLLLNFYHRTDDENIVATIDMSPVKEELVVLEDKIMVEEKDPVEVIPEADINKNEEPKKEEDKKDKIFVRPRFVKEELNITKKLLVVIIPESDWSGDMAMRKYYNSSLQPHINDVAYLDKPSSTSKTDILDIVKKLGSSHLSGYQFYYIIPDTALVMARNLKRLVDPLVTTQLTYTGRVGVAEAGPEDVCQLQSGILLSHHLVKAMTSNLDWCYRNKISYDQSYNLQNCIFHSSKVKCSNTLEENSKLYQARKHSTHSSGNEDFIAVYDVNSMSSMKLLMQNLKLDEIKHYSNQLSKLDSELSSLINTSKYDLAPSWPTGSVMNFNGWDRFDMGIYHHFNQTHNFFEDDYESASKHDERESEDIGSLLNLCNLQPEDFSAGWSRMDATRGKDVVLEVSHRANDRKLSSRKCQIVKELSNPEIVQMPFVTESFKISLIVPVQEKDSQKTMTLLRSFAKNAIEKNDRIFLMLVFLYSPERPDKNNNNDFFKEVKQLALQISKKYKKDQSKSSSHLLWYSMQTKGQTPTDTELMDLVTQKLDNKTIILLGSPDMEMKADYFNRVRMNTIQNKQVFCPIPFTEYHPSIVYGDKRPPVSLVFNTTAGHFDNFNTGHVSFYKSDYLQARQSGGGDSVIKHESELKDKHEEDDEDDVDLCQMFRRQNNLHALRAPDPGLLLRYEEVTCDESVIKDSDKMQLCKLRNQRSFARRKTLAMMVLDREARSRN